MDEIKRNFYTETLSFITTHTHKAFCALTLGLAVVVYALGNLAERAVSWISECCGTAKKTDLVARETLTKTNHLIVSKLLQAYNLPKEGWVMIPPKDLLQAEAPFIVGSGAIGYEGNGRWKIHVSIDPAQMEEAIPIIVNVLHSEQAPRLGFKMQTKANLTSVHQIGKELAIIFDGRVETDQVIRIQNCLSLLWNSLHSAQIRPERGFVLTPQTMDAIKHAPERTQVKEKQNLEMGKFDRAIPCPNGLNYFHYRDENVVPMLDAEIGDLRGIPGVYAASDIVALAQRNPNLAHNPANGPDPFLTLKINPDTLP